MDIPYIDYGGTQMLRPPYVAENVGFYGFLVHADMEALQALLDERLNRPSGGAVHFEPAGPFVLFVFVALGKMYSQNPPDRDKGWLGEHEFAVWVRVIDRDRKRAFWFHPYMFVDDSYALVLGREVYGFPKAWGWMDIPANPSTASAFSIETLMLPHFDPAEQGVRRTLVRAARVSGGGDPARALLDDAAFLAEVMNLLGKDDSFLDKLEELKSAFVDLVHRSEPFVFLKQFAAPDKPGVACYQAIVESENNATALHGACVLSGTWRIDITPADSHPIAKDLGLADNTLEVSAPFYINFDMVVGFGKNIYTATSRAPAKPQKIAILGGGVGAMATAIQLTAEDGWQSRYDITVYQMGWRLGGKGASGRGECNRIEEHGLHIWLGFYENAFRVMRQVYEENKVNRPEGSPLRDWTEAFHTHDFIALMDRDPPTDSEWMVWPIRFPPADGLPGDGRPLTFWDSLVQGIRWLHSLYHDSGFHQRHAQPVNDPGFVADVKRLLGGVRHELDLAGDLLLGAQLTAIRVAAEALHHDASHHHKFEHDLLGGLLRRFRQSFREHIQEDLAAGDVEARRLYELIDLGATIAMGLLLDGYMFDHALLDNLETDLQDWLKAQGADPVHCEVRTSAVIRGLYDLVFAYRNGETARPSFEAGVALRSMLLIVGAYKGAIFWKMQAGMGDVVFGPMYQALKRRGVKFEFFHRVEELALSAGGGAVDSIRLGVQAALKDPAAGYNPLVDCDGLPSWPAAPLYDQLVDGDELKRSGDNLESFWTTRPCVASKTLKAGQDFDQAVLAISIGSFPYLFADPAQLPEAFRLMIQNVETVRTQAMQLWVNQPLERLGWQLGSVVLDAYADPMNTWAVMDQLLVRENWPADVVKGIHYFCGQMEGGIPPQTDTDAPQQALDQVKAAGKDFIESRLPALWPKMTGPEFQIVSDYYRANIDPSERYVLSVPGSTRYRLRANESGLSNVILAGDWIRNGFNAGCVEAAVMSGIQAANAIAGQPLDAGIDGPLQSQLREEDAAS
ncbi:MAG: FAD-dependent oxidoreductase [Bryobacteraceae bacterium]|jgi:uncharacterized protein with NAD-binding domain and iron-sulfur cluster